MRPGVPPWLLIVTSLAHRARYPVSVPHLHFRTRRIYKFDATCRLARSTTGIPPVIAPSLAWQRGGGAHRRVVLEVERAQRGVAAHQRRPQAGQAGDLVVIEPQVLQPAAAARGQAVRHTQPHSAAIQPPAAPRHMLHCGCAAQPTVTQWTQTNGFALSGGDCRTWAVLLNQLVSKRNVFQPYTGCESAELPSNSQAGTVRHPKGLLCYARRTGVGVAGGCQGRITAFPPPLRDCSLGQEGAHAGPPGVRTW